MCISYEEQSVNAAYGKNCFSPTCNASHTNTVVKTWHSDIVQKDDTYIYHTTLKAQSGCMYWKHNFIPVLDSPHDIRCTGYTQKNGAV
jgi:hypothetical protein